MLSQNQEAFDPAEVDEYHAILHVCMARQKIKKSLLTCFVSTLNITFSGPECPFQQTPFYNSAFFRKSGPTVPMHLKLRTLPTKAPGKV